MTPLEEGLRQALAGHKLLSVHAEVFVSADGQRSLDAQRLALVWDGITLIFRCGRDGASLIVDPLSLRPMNMAELGKVDVDDWSAQETFRLLIGDHLRSAFIFDEGQIEVGAQLVLTRGTIELFNNGDDLKVATRLPVKITHGSVPRALQGTAG